MANSTANSAYWEHFSHVADLGIRGLGNTIEEAFQQAALALTAAVCNPAGVNDDERIEIQCEAPDKELLLTEWLNSIIYEMATRKMLFSRFRVQIKDTNLYAILWGETIDRKRHRPAVEVKGATFTELKVARQEDRSWIAQCVIDV